MDKKGRKGEEKGREREGKGGESWTPLQNFAYATVFVCIEATS